MDETFVRIAGPLDVPLRAVDSGGQTVDFYSSKTRDREPAKCFLSKPWPSSSNQSAVSSLAQLLPSGARGCHRRKASSTRPERDRLHRAGER